jgi:hypothetical protein
MATTFKTRWTAVIHYRSDKGLVDVTHYFEEIEDLHDLVEAGPNFYAIERIEITLTDQSFPQPGLTVEQAEDL